MAQREPRFLTEAKEAADALFSDTSVPLRKTLEHLVELRDEIDMKIECIKSDLKGER